MGPKGRANDYLLGWDRTAFEARSARVSIESRGGWMGAVDS